MMIITYTTAPEVYDGFGTKTISYEWATIGITTVQTIRKVKTPDEHVHWQRARYMSGMHMARCEEDFQDAITMGLVSKRDIGTNSTGPK